MAQIAKHPELGLMIDINVVAQITTFTRNQIWYQEFKAKSNKLPWQSYYAMHAPEKPWYRALDVLAWVEEQGGFGGISRIPPVNSRVPATMITKPKEK